MTRQITGALFRSMILSGAAAIDSHKSEINELNVFPVPDGDTGTNMSLTMGAGATALADSAPESIGRAADITAGALLRGARGNSGVILSLLFRGIARHLKDLETANAFDFATAISYGVDSAYKAVMKPAEGTILTVSRLAASAAFTEAERESDIEAILEHALKAGNEALANTININPVLKKAGVVDAGGKGYLYIMEGMLKALRGDSVVCGAAAPVAASVTPKTPADVIPSAEVREKADFGEFDTNDIQFAYCTEFIVHRDNGKDPELLRGFLDARGDSIVVVDDDEVIKVHVHSNEPGAILTEALTYGPLLTVKVENMREQHTGKVVESGNSAPDAGTDGRAPVGITPPEPAHTPLSGTDTEADTMTAPVAVPELPYAPGAAPDKQETSVPAGDLSAEPAETIPAVFPEPADEPSPAEDSGNAGAVSELPVEMPMPAAEQAPAEEVCVAEAARKPFGVVAVCAGEGMANVFRDLGADHIIFGGQTMNPSTEDILNQIEATPSETVFVLPNNKNIIMAAQQCMRLTEKKVIVIPSKTMPQGISALIALDSGATVAENVLLMSRAIERVHTAQITYAARDSAFDGQTIKSGDYLALMEDTLIATGKDTTALVDAIAFSMAQYGPEFITIFYGEDIDAATADQVLKRLTAAIPEAEASVVNGGQPVYYFIIAAE